MATRGMIGIELDNGKIEAVYSHWDNSPETNGMTLVKHYKRKKANRLMELGSISSLGKNIGKKHDFNNRIEGMTTFYGRDRAETDIGCRLYNSIDAVFNYQCDAEYAYVLGLDDIWRVATPQNTTLIPVNDLL